MNKVGSEKKMTRIIVTRFSYLIYPILQIICFKNNVNIGESSFFLNRFLKNVVHTYLLLFSPLWKSAHNNSHEFKRAKTDNGNSGYYSIV